jgi:hypothetical protein
MEEDYFEFNAGDRKGLENALPNVPFQVYINDIDYALKYNLPFKQALTVTHTRYVISKKQVRYALREAIFDFPWDENSIQILPVCSTN